MESMNPDLLWLARDLHDALNSTPALQAAAQELRVFGSAVDRLDQAGDLDVGHAPAIPQTGVSDTDLQTLQTVLLPLARRYYGWLDPFVQRERATTTGVIHSSPSGRQSSTLWVRSDDARAWVPAKQHRAITQAIQQGQPFHAWYADEVAPRWASAPDFKAAVLAHQTTWVKAYLRYQPPTQADWMWALSIVSSETVFPVATDLVLPLLGYGEKAGWLKLNERPNGQLADLMTTLQRHAARGGHLAEVRATLKHIHSASDRRHAFRVAVRENQVKVVQWLIPQVDVHENQEWAIRQALKKAHPEMTQLLLKHADMNKTIAHLVRMEAWNSLDHLGRVAGEPWVQQIRSSCPPDKLPEMEAALTAKTRHDTLAAAQTSRPGRPRQRS